MTEGVTDKTAGEADGDLVSSPFPVVLAGPSGSGKTTVGRALAGRRSDVRFSVSATTRPPRPGEKDGEDYQFLDRETFRRLREEEQLLEWAEVHGHWYGTPRANLEEARREGAHLLLDIDVQGARSVRRLVPKAVSIFLLTPDGERILRRLRGRGSEKEDELERRLAAAEAEMAAAAEFDYVVVNDRLEETVDTVECILHAESIRTERLGRGVREKAERLSREIRMAMDGGRGRGSGKPPREDEDIR